MHVFNTLDSLNIMNNDWWMFHPFFRGKLVIRFYNAKVRFKKIISEIDEFKRSIKSSYDLYLDSNGLC